MRPDLAGTRLALTRRYGVFVAALISVFALAVYADVRRSQHELLQAQVRQFAAAAAAQLPLLHHEVDELAEAAGQDPLAFRMKLLKPKRAAVLKAAP